MAEESVENLAARYVQMWELPNHRKHMKEIASIGRQLTKRLGKLEAYIVINQAKEAWKLLGGSQEAKK